MDIGKCFSSSKKRDLSDNSKEATDHEKAKKATSVTATMMVLKKVSTLQAVEVFFLTA